MLSTVLKPGSGIEALQDRRDFLRNLGVSAAALSVYSSVGKLFAEEPAEKLEPVPEPPLPKFISDCPNEKERTQMELAWLIVKAHMENAKIQDGDFEKRFNSHVDQLEEKDFVTSFRATLRELGAMEDKEGKLAGGIRVHDPRVHGSITCDHSELIVSVCVVQDETIMVETSEKAILRQNTTYKHSGLGPLTCSIVNAEGQCIRTFQLHKNGTGRVSIKGIPFPFSIKLTPCEEALKQDPPPRNAIPLFFGDHEVVV